MKILTRNKALALGLAAGLAAQVAPAQAQFVQTAVCGSSGCTCKVSTATIEDVEATLRLRTKEGAIDMILVQDAAGFSWQDLTPAQLDRKYGGDGSCPLQLADEFAPEDGLWQISVGTTDTSACKMVSGQVPGSMTSQTRQITWGGVFHPEKLFMEARGMIRWTETGRLNWRGVLADESMAANGGSSGASVIQTVRMVSPTEVTGSSVFEYDLTIPGLDAAAATVIAGMQCKTVTPFSARKVG